MSITLDRFGQALCTGMVLGDELPIWRAFGPYGDRVPAFVAFVQRLTADQAAEIAERCRRIPADRPWQIYENMADDDQKQFMIATHARYAPVLALRRATSLSHLAPDSAWSQDRESIEMGKRSIEDLGWPL